VIKKLIGATICGFKYGFPSFIGLLKYDRRRDGHLKVGDDAPLRCSVVSDDCSAHPLSWYIKKSVPNVLIFGSFT
jgi:hypothetical protein